MGGSNAPHQSPYRRVTPRKNAPDVVRGVSRRHIAVDRLRYRNRCVLVGTGVFGDVTMNYYCSDCFKLVQEFKRELGRIGDDGMLIDSVSHVGAQLSKAALCYEYTLRIAGRLGENDEENSETTKQDIKNEYANFAAKMGRRIDELNGY